MRSLRTAPNSGAETGTGESATVTRYRPNSRASPRPRVLILNQILTLSSFVLQPSNGDGVASNCQ